MRRCVSIAPVGLFFALALEANAQLLNPATDGLWRGSLSAGLSATAGNTESASFSIRADGTRARVADKLSFQLSGLYGSKSEHGTKGRTAHQLRGGVKYDYNLSAATFVFGALDLERDRLQELELRSVTGAGFGSHIIRTSATTFDVFGGLTYNRERFFNESRDSVELLLGEESIHKISDSTSFKQRFALYPNLREGGEFRIALDANMTVALTAAVGLQLTLSNRYLSNPQPGIKKNDLLFLTGVNVKFGPR